ncbi:NADH-ubiquinone oxidoreductase chain 5-like, partial [Harmonia axyridis]|uniref:NADH-ubiquinone oxidoreductase chain 5-like n=1 Tax=Harmonia axyridis TaxID=115357 RepID=UPI001E276E6F
MASHYPDATKPWEVVSSDLIGPLPRSKRGNSYIFVNDYFSNSERSGDALFKALLFICAGNFIHLMGECQDIRFIGGLVYKTPITVIYFNVRNLSLCGILFFFGFYSKDLIIEVYSMSRLNILIYLIILISLTLTVSYTVRLLNYVLIWNLPYISTFGINYFFIN